ncbi:hypothetical protein ACJ72_07737, partial [Emergomyces africanus]
PRQSNGSIYDSIQFIQIRARGWIPSKRGSKKLTSDDGKQQQQQQQKQLEAGRMVGSTERGTRARRARESKSQIKEMHQAKETDYGKGVGTGRGGDGAG